MTDTVSLEDVVQDENISLEPVSLQEFVTLFLSEDPKEPVEKCEIWTL